MPQNMIVPHAVILLQDAAQYVIMLLADAVIYVIVFLANAIFTAPQ